MDRQGINPAVTIKRTWKTLSGAAFVLMALPVCLTAQVAIKLTLPFDKAVLFEDVIATVVIVNNSGQILTLDSAGGAAGFRLDVERKDGRIMRRSDDTPLVTAEQIMPGQERAFQFNLARLFAIRTAGIYKIRAGVEMGGAYYVSPEATLEVANSFELQRLTAGIAGDAPAVRTYILSYFQKDNAEYLYLRIEDLDQNICGLFNIGRLVRIRSPEIKTDEAGNLHVLFQTLGAGFVHTAFTPFGVQLFVKNHAGVRGKANLLQQPNGRIVVADGIEAKTTTPPTAGKPAAPDNNTRKQGAGGMWGRFINSPDTRP